MVGFAALKHYQRVHSFSQPEVCGCSGPVLDQGKDPNINVVLPESGPGFRTYNREEGGRDQVGVQAFIDFIHELGRAWEGQSAVPFQVGDISREGGGPFPPHEAHQKGLECDLRPFRRDGEMLPTNINDASYDRGRTREFCQAIRQLNPNATILFNDPQLIREGLCRYHKGHHNHLHLGIRPATLSQDGC